MFMAAVAMAFSLSYAQDELREITTDGTASILNNDKAMARDVAIQDALRNAVEQVTGAVISSSTVVENAMVMEDNIYSKAKGYVKAYSVLSEGEADNGMTYNVKVKAQVRAGAIKDDIGDILRGAGNPRLMVLITEQNIGQHQYSGLDVNLNVAENAIMENMRNKGFEFVDQEANERNMRKDKALAAMQGDAAAAAFIGDRAGAEVIITGKSFAKEASGVSDMLGGMKSMQATVSVKAINTDDGRVLVSKSQSDKTIHIDEVAGGTKAIEMAANKLADYLADEIVKKFTRGSNTVTLNVTGITDYQMYTDLVNILKYEIRGIKGVSEREMAGSTGLIEVDTKFNSGQLTSELLYKTFPNFRVRIISRTANKINLKLVARKQ
ncbi:MAG: hypothetical protein A2509_07135 [Candidatus Edwardsbacteria bacterium RIFOXYD12_FULL_50_11]|uniref:Flagellar assembly protein T N-terminal domain-containing protein n=1 Tax=Candidatus Edwardsbacteria bacterium GWF2_54_11 TaxID=1817851 RepID=A0A1F5RGC7_9BACT|nr:MAG: hypothetical protein A2502_01240 [Candidatus Edwardsbacteria bacterium RifOxyC12_full_54_24]OGF08496.1 MAG: hypothetical protein A2273_06020 [Candidatus Edwardsbacteria bacterium RifOxyA12_full_54_48]OGF11440.1 MAG: hypothetical protein A3K15_03735 [Candidatus Edwardsbacteria bacterium GWE2_54_12]OGF13374.1 MAG: hypothetical protein A2024_00200 [Candidatus Edwardsbacteria bacterium GWF2_54_11]OGF16449.1 MAG: hypothetical protein A2509_07135 [Candidatus Edwardsbacteria bacterium RIFOXYD1